MGAAGASCLRFGGPVWCFGDKPYVADGVHQPVIGLPKQGQE